MKWEFERRVLKSQITKSQITKKIQRGGNHKYQRGRCFASVAGGTPALPVAGAFFETAPPLLDVVICRLLLCWDLML
jgi:hypothetical protein